jgi:hypothetical protein
MSSPQESLDRKDALNNVTKEETKEPIGIFLSSWPLYKKELLICASIKITQEITSRGFS